MDTMPLHGDAYQRLVRHAHSNLHELEIVGAPIPERSTLESAVRPAVLESWRRSLSRLADPGGVRSRLTYGDSALAEARRRHPFQAIMPLLTSRLIEPAVDAGLLVALGDAEGCLLWVEGESAVRRRAETMGFVPGTDWSEDVMGTSAPGLALSSRAAVQISGAEHFSAQAHSWSCSAVPVTDPRTGQVIGIIDVTGGGDAVSGLVLPLLAATAKAAGEELGRLDAHGLGGGHLGAGHLDGRPDGVRLEISEGPARLVASNGTRVDLTRRHAEILLLLQQVPGGITAAGLAESLHEGGGSEVTVRAEMARLRRTISPFSEMGLAVEARPYRLRGHLSSCLDDVRSALDAGDIDAALAAHGSGILASSDAPGVIDLRDRARARVREAVLQQGSWQQVRSYCAQPETADDPEMLMLLLRLAPADAPIRAEAIVRLDELGC